MAVLLYREGKTHKVRGVECEMRRFPISDLHTMLDSGWLTDPNDINSQKHIPSEDDIRLEAKEKGIRNWHNKKIENLLVELGYVNPED